MYSNPRNAALSLEQQLEPLSIFSAGDHYPGLQGLPHHRVEMAACSVELPHKDSEPIVVSITVTNPEQTIQGPTISGMGLSNPDVACATIARLSLGAAYRAGVPIPVTRLSLSLGVLRLMVANKLQAPHPDVPLLPHLHILEISFTATCTWPADFVAPACFAARDQIIVKQLPGSRVFDGMLAEATRNNGHIVLFKSICYRKDRVHNPSLTVYVQKDPDDKCAKVASALTAALRSHSVNVTVTYYTGCD